MPDYRHNHYVPEWYQKRFIPAESKHRKLWYLDLHPSDGYTDGAGTFHRYSGLHHWGPRKSFALDDLYTSYLGGEASNDVERLFFGDIDRRGKGAVEAYGAFSHENPKALQAIGDLLMYLVTQRLRTPKGLGWLAAQMGTSSHEALLRGMVQLRGMYNAVWSECVWQIADAYASPTKFLITDHPVTFYNRRCGPHSQWCRGVADPDPRFNGTHVLFPLSLDRLLILTNLSWVRNPYQSEIELRPNSALDRSGYFKFMDVQTDRHLSEREVLEINFIMKNRAHRYVAAGSEDWLYPERNVNKSDWASFGEGYLLMPDPRSIHMGGTMYVGYDNGRTDSSDEYGRKPWDRNYGSGASAVESAALNRFKGEFSRKFGPVRRGRTWEAGRLEQEVVDTDLHEYYLGLEEEGRRAMRRAMSAGTTRS